MQPRDSQNLEMSDVKVTWGNAARAKAEHREEARQRHLDRPLSDRLADAIAMMQSPRREPAQP